MQIPPAALASQPHLIVATRVFVLPQGPPARKGPVADPAGALPGCGVRKARVVWTGAWGVAWLGVVVVVVGGHGGGIMASFSLFLLLDQEIKLFFGSSSDFGP